jgi:hypothetical protein
MLEDLIGHRAGQRNLDSERDSDTDGVVRMGRYELLHPLGIGGMAEVFKARALGPGGFARDVVIKRILPAHGDDPEFIRMFVDEAKLLGLLHHPNIVDVYDFGEDDGVLFLRSNTSRGRRCRASCARCARRTARRRRRSSPTWRARCAARWTTCTACATVTAGRWMPSTATSRRPTSSSPRREA